MVITEEQKRAALDKFAEGYPGIVDYVAHKTDLTDGLTSELEDCMEQVGIVLSTISEDEDAYMEILDDLWDFFYSNYTMVMIHKEDIEKVKESVWVVE